MRNIALATLLGASLLSGGLVGTGSASVADTPVPDCSEFATNLKALSFFAPAPGPLRSVPSDEPTWYAREKAGAFHELSGPAPDPLHSAALDELIPYGAEETAPFQVAVSYCHVDMVQCYHGCGGDPTCQAVCWDEFIACQR